MGDAPVYTRTIYLNELFLHKQMGLQVFFESKAEFAKYFNAESLVEVITHELAHAILTDTAPKTQNINGGHGKEHNELTEELSKLLKSFSEYQELKSH
jgi:predicted SprT family Zn-dependent metalloprotease